jgi:oxygen-independent coproporphyrinogen-3 oxidase
LGINRISLGVQTLNDLELERLGRNHRSKDVTVAFEVLYPAGLTNISVDLMFGLENQTIASWEETLKKTVDLRPKHISTYNLTIEKNTAYDREHTEGKLNLPSDEDQAEMLIRTKKILTGHGYDPYEISNAAIPGFESKHNMLYWTGKPYLGFGVSAHSFENENGIYRRYWNTKNIPLYMKSIESDVSVIDSEEILDAKTHLRERLMTGLRLRKGIDIDLLEKEGLFFTPSMKKQMEELMAHGRLVKNGPLLSIPTEHIPLTNEILLRLF